MAEKQIEQLDGIGDEDSDIRHLFSYNLQRLASISSRIATNYMLDQFDLTVQEWRALAVLDFLDSTPPILLAERAGLQKSQVSRLIAEMEERGYIRRAAHPTDKRSTLLSLTEKGKETVKRILKQSRLRNAHMLEDFTDAERCELMRLMGKAIAGSKRYLNEMKSANDQNFEIKDEPASFFEGD